MPDSPKELQAGEESPLAVMWFATRLGTLYEMPDLLSAQVTDTHRQLDYSNADSMILMVNVSGVMLSIPKRIIKTAGVGDRCFWEAP